MKQRLVFLLAGLFLLTGVAMAKTVKGVVIDASDKEPIVGASVLVKGTAVGASTNIDGEFNLNAPDNAKTLVVSYVGMATKEVAITGGEMKIELTSVTTDLDEVVVVAYGSQKKSSITGAISQVKSEDIQKRPVSNVVSALEGSTSGITSTANYGVPGDAGSIQIRGIGTVNGSTSPLYVVDGVPYGGSVSDLNPDDIESMSVLKDAASAALYGNRAANGVILITTKKANKEKVSITFKTTQGWYNRGLKEYETTNASQWMNVAYMDMLSTYVSTQNINRYDKVGMAAAHQYVKDNFISGYAYVNIFDAPDDALFDANGKFVNAPIKSGYKGDLDWFDQAQRTGYRGEYYLSGSGATEKSDYFFSLGYLSEDGYMKDADFERISGRAAINVTPVKWVKTGLSVNAAHKKTSSSMNGVGDGDNKVNNPFMSCRNMAPIYAVHAHDPFTGEYLLDELGKRYYNLGHIPNYLNPETGEVEDYIVNNRTQDRHVIYESELNSDKTITNTVNAIAYADIMLPYGFTISVKGNLNTKNTENTVMSSAKIGDYVGKGGQLDKYVYNYKTWNFQQQLRWNKTYGKHTIMFLLGHENYSYQYDYTAITKTGEAFPDIPALSNYSTFTSSRGYRNRYTTESYLTRVQYNFDDRYNLEASFRRDGSSRFAKDVRWGNFGSIGANWVFSNEEFMKDFTWLNNGKLRADWGQVGYDAAADYYAYRSLYVSTTHNSKPAYYLSQNAAEKLKWETGESWGIALEGRLFDRWNISLEYYDKRNKDLLFNVYAPLSQGTTETTSSASNQSTSAVTMYNMGTISNRGIEINTDVDIWKNKDWTINLAANLTTLKNEVLSLPEQNKDGIDNTTQFIKVGKSRYEFYTRTYRGIDQLTGQALYDMDFEKYHIVASDGQIIGGKYVLNEKTGKNELVSEATKNYVHINGKYYSTNADEAERTFKGHAMPSVYGSFTPTIRWKDLTLSMLFTYSLGGKVYDSNYNSLTTAQGNPGNKHVDVLNSWTTVPDFLINDDGTPKTDYEGADRISTSLLPEFSNANSKHNNAASDRFLISADYWQIKNINLSYSLPRKWTNAVGLSRVLVSFSAENVYTHTSRQGINPMMSMNGYQYNYMVPARVFTFGLNVNI